MPNKTKKWSGWLLETCVRVAAMLSGSCSVMLEDMFGAVQKEVN